MSVRLSHMYTSDHLAIFHVQFGLTIFDISLVFSFFSAERNKNNRKITSSWTLITGKVRSYWETIFVLHVYLLAMKNKTPSYRPALQLFVFCRACWCDGYWWYSSTWTQEIGYMLSMEPFSISYTTWHWWGFFSTCKAVYGPIGDPTWELRFCSLSVSRGWHYVVKDQTFHL